MHHYFTSDLFFEKFSTNIMGNVRSRSANAKREATEYRLSEQVDD